MSTRTTVCVGASALLTILLLAGCTPAATPDAVPSATVEAQPSPTATPTAPAPAATATSATATAATLEVFAEPGGNVTTTLTNPQESGASSPFSSPRRGGGCPYVVRQVRTDSGG